MSSQAKTAPPRNPSIARDLIALGDIYLTLGWLAFQRLRYGPLWPWDRLPRRSTGEDRHRSGAQPVPLRRR